MSASTTKVWFALQDRTTLQYLESEYGPAQHHRTRIDKDGARRIEGQCRNVMGEGKTQLAARTPCDTVGSRDYRREEVWRTNVVEYCWILAHHDMRTGAVCFSLIHLRDAIRAKLCFKFMSCCRLVSALRDSRPRPYDFISCRWTFLWPFFLFLDVLCGSTCCTAGPFFAFCQVTGGFSAVGPRRALSCSITFSTFSVADWIFFFVRVVLGCPFTFSGVTATVSSGTGHPGMS